MPDLSHRPAESFRPQWRADYASGHAPLDLQHRRLFRVINTLIDAELEKSSRKLEILDELIMHVLQHFHDEEELLARCGYEGLAAHARIHGQLIEKILTLRHGLIAQITSFNELLDFLAKDVVEDHLVQTDRLFFGALAHAP